MTKHFETDYSAPGSQPELPAELLPTPADGSAEQLTPRAEKVEQPEIQVDSRIPEAVRPAAQAHLKEVDDDWDRINIQAQTTANGPDARSRATVETEEDRSAREILEITKRARRLVDSPAQQRNRRIREANIKRRYGETGPSAIAKGEI